MGKCCVCRVEETGMFDFSAYLSPLYSEENGREEIDCDS